MKKVVLVLGLVFITAIILVFSFGIQIGNVRIGKQIDLKTKQDYKLENSDFYENYYSNNKLIVLNTWATWCKPCIEEMPELNKVKNHFKKDSIYFLSISVDTDSIRLVNFLKKSKFDFNDITLSNLENRNAIINTLNNKKTDNWIESYSVPITYLIKNKKIIEKVDGLIEKEELIQLIEKNK